MLQLSITRGADSDYPIRAINRGGQSSPVLTATDTLSAHVWPGDDRPDVFAPNVTWYTAGGSQTGYDQGEVLMRVSAAQSISLAFGASYSFEVWRTAVDGTKECLARGSLLCLPAPQTAVAAVCAAVLSTGSISGVTITSAGSGYWPSTSALPVMIVDATGSGAIASATSDSGGAIRSIEVLAGGTGYTSPAFTIGLKPTTYATFNDMQLECAWIGQFADAEADQAGFTEQLVAAREWLDGLILGAFPAVGIFGSALADGWPTYQGRYSMLANTWLRGVLDCAGLLTAGPRGRQAVRACACHAVSHVLRSQPGNDNLRLAGYYSRRAQAEASTLVAELDINNDGVAEIAVPLQVTNTRFG